MEPTIRSANILRTEPLARPSARSSQGAVFPRHDAIPGRRINTAPMRAISTMRSCRMAVFHVLWSRVASSRESASDRAIGAGVSCCGWDSDGGGAAVEPGVAGGLGRLRRTAQAIRTHTPALERTRMRCSVEVFSLCVSLPSVWPVEMFSGPLHRSHIASTTPACHLRGRERFRGSWGYQFPVFCPRTLRAGAKRCFRSR